MSASTFVACNRANRYTLTDVLRGQLGFNGMVVSDSNSIGELVNHGYAADRKEAGKKAVMAGVDMDMVTESYRYDIPELVEEGIIPEAVDGPCGAFADQIPARPV
jgi:beta-glucosidase